MLVLRYLGVSLLFVLPASFRPPPQRCRPVFPSKLVSPGSVGVSGGTVLSGVAEQTEGVSTGTETAGRRRERVAIVGAGFSGAVCAWVLSQSPSFEVDVIEASDAWGGHMLYDSITLPGYQNNMTHLASLFKEDEVFRNHSLPSPKRGDGDGFRCVANVGGPLHFGTFYNVQMILDFLGVPDRRVGASGGDKDSFYIVHLARGRQYVPDATEILFSLPLLVDILKFLVISKVEPDSDLGSFFDRHTEGSSGGGESESGSFKWTFSSEFFNLLRWSLKAYEFDHSDEDIIRQHSVKAAAAYLYQTLFFVVIFRDLFKFSYPSWFASSGRQANEETLWKRLDGKFQRKLKNWRGGEGNETGREGEKETEGVEESEGVREGSLLERFPWQRTRDDFSFHTCDRREMLRRMLSRCDNVRLSTSVASVRPKGALQVKKGQKGGKQEKEKGTRSLFSRFLFKERDSKSEEATDLDSVVLFDKNDKEIGRYDRVILTTSPAVSKKLLRNVPEFDGWIGRVKGEGMAVQLVRQRDVAEWWRLKETTNRGDSTSSPPPLCLEDAFPFSERVSPLEKGHNCSEWRSYYAYEISHVSPPGIPEPVIDWSLPVTPDGIPKDPHPPPCALSPLCQHQWEWVVPSPEYSQGRMETADAIQGTGGIFFTGHCVSGVIRNLEVQAHNALALCDRHFGTLPPWRYFLPLTPVSDERRWLATVPLPEAVAGSLKEWVDLVSCLAIGLGTRFVRSLEGKGGGMAQRSAGTREKRLWRPSMKESRDLRPLLRR
uniref:Amine oxidase domain-containing protein n=1 Tax=Chromera velia CCMP2878 TaxID=1169474 RepID=A0A0G4F685_9ALVE|eukprot:Cvel_15409.t1-p1 / transcript=Cvel_15409.t1 / gene=Cvel_15409 / organism=Chromera_velia_CCMP2878 / gene_product=hypothetical protein / transcript_product=hypothetical protein / location=Cvel_scaffold1138:31905-36417(+) / protein_length=772 / sequence_SO=supercontig / SO=protein_coding / is_pseudo=false